MPRKMRKTNGATANNTGSRGANFPANEGTFSTPEVGANVVRDGFDYQMPHRDFQPPQVNSPSVPMSVATADSLVNPFEAGGGTFMECKISHRIF